ncbi:MAG: tetratricopeptide repeat protein [Deltaproteobacteria bacterium]|nr:tetratricopeptide repeat protein [Candidatus Zymogenaceae bacterium]
MQRRLFRVSKKTAFIAALLALSLVSLPLFAVEEDYETVYERATKSFNRGDYEKAVEGFTEVIEIILSGDADVGINIATVYFNRGLSYKKMLAWEEAADDFSMVIGLYPNDAEAYYHRGGCYKILGLEEEALRDHNRACEIDDEYCTEKMLKEKRERKEAEMWWKTDDD